MIFPIGVTSQSINVSVVDDAGLPVLNLTHLTFPSVFYSKAGAFADVQIELVNLALITTPWVSGGVIERGRGLYRLDLPNAIFALDGRITLSGEDTDKHLLVEPIEVSSIFSIIEADQIIDTSVDPWALVYILKGTGGIGVGTELLRKRLMNVNGADLTSTSTVVGQVKQ